MCRSSRRIERMTLRRSSPSPRKCRRDDDTDCRFAGGKSKDIYFLRASGHLPVVRGCEIDDLGVPLSPSELPGVKDSELQQEPLAILRGVLPGPRYVLCHGVAGTRIVSISCHASLPSSASAPPLACTLGAAPSRLLRCGRAQAAATRPARRCRPSRGSSPGC